MSRAPRAADDGASRRSIVAALAERGALSRRQIADVTGIGAATVGTQVRRLLTAGLVHELDPKQTTNGRPQIPIELIDTLRIVGVAIDTDQIVVVITALDGHLIAQRRAPFDPAGHDLSPIAAAVSEMLGAVGVTDCLAVGISVSGVVDERHESVVVSVVLNWHDLALGQEVAARLGIPVYVENDVLALASRELSFASLQHADSFLLVSLNDGVGMAIVVGRRIFRGADAASTEFGHVCVEPQGQPCRCGGSGCLQTVAGLQELILTAPLPEDAPRTLDGLAQTADAGDRPTRRYLYEVGSVLGRAVGGTATLLGINTVLVTGQTTQLWPYLSAGFTATMVRHTTTLHDGVRTTVLPWSETAEAAGAAGLALAKALDTLT